MAPNVGFDWRVKLEWLDAVAWKTATERGISEIRGYLNDFLRSEYPNEQARGKAITVLTRIWTRVPQQHQPLQTKALEILTEESSDARLWLHWGMTLVAYPFFRDIADIIGRLLRLQNDVSLEQIHRRIVERWGERSTIQRASRIVIRSMVDWDVIRETPVRRVYIPAPKKEPASLRVQLWFLEALLNAEPGQSIILQGLPRLPVAFPFKIDLPVAEIRKCSQFEIQRQGSGLDMITIVKR